VQVHSFPREDVIMGSSVKSNRVISRSRLMRSAFSETLSYETVQFPVISHHRLQRQPHPQDNMGKGTEPLFIVQLNVF